MTRVELNMKRRLHEGFPGSRDRFPTGEKEYKDGAVNPTQLNLLKKALEKCGLVRVDRGDRLNSAYRKYSDSVVEMYVWPHAYTIMGEIMYATVTIKKSGIVGIEISSYGTFPKSLSKMFKECGFETSVSYVGSSEGREADSGGSYNKDDLENAPLDEIKMYGVDLKDATLMFGKLAQHLPKAQAQYTKDTRNSDGSYKTEDQYNKEHGISGSGSYQLVIDWGDGDPIEIEANAKSNSFGSAYDVLEDIITSIGAEDDFIDMMNTMYNADGEGGEDPSPYHDLRPALMDYINIATPSWDSDDECTISQETVNHIKDFLEHLAEDGVIGSDSVRVTIDEVNMNPARAKKVAKVPQRALHFEKANKGSFADKLLENRQCKSKVQKALKESTEADINKQAKQIQRDLTKLLDDNWADEDTDENEEAEIANRIVVCSVLNGAYTALKDYGDADAYMVGDEIPGLEDCDEAIVDEVNEMISDLYEDNMESDEDAEDEFDQDDLDELSEKLCKKMATIVYKVLMQYDPVDEYFVDHGKALFN